MIPQGLTAASLDGPGLMMSTLTNKCTYRFDRLTPTIIISFITLNCLVQEEMQYCLLSCYDMSCPILLSYAGLTMSVFSHLTIKTPRCDGLRTRDSSCTYLVFVHANTIHASAAQNYALIFTTSGESICLVIPLLVEVQIFLFLF